MNQALFFWFCLQVFRQAGPPQQVNCLAQSSNKAHLLAFLKLGCPCRLNYLETTHS